MNGGGQAGERWLQCIMDVSKEKKQKETRPREGMQNPKHTKWQKGCQWPKSAQTHKTKDDRRRKAREKKIKQAIPQKPNPFP